MKKDLLSAGINSMMDMIVFCILFFIIIESLKESGALDSISNGLLKLCKAYDLFNLSL